MDRSPAGRDGANGGRYLGRALARIARDCPSSQSARARRAAAARSRAWGDPAPAPVVSRRRMSVSVAVSSRSRSWLDSGVVPARSVCIGVAVGVNELLPSAVTPFRFGLGPGTALWPVKVGPWLDPE